MYEILKEIIKYFETLDFLSNYIISSNYEINVEKNIVLNILYNTSNTKYFGSDMEDEYILQIDIFAKTKKEVFEDAHLIMEHFKTLRLINLNNIKILKMNDTPLLYEEILTNNNTQILIRYLFSI